MTFDPTGPKFARSDGLNMRIVKCPCGGVCFDVTIGLAQRMNVKQYQCDKCSSKYAKRIS